jgi:broad specificity phosphatase PhoE
MCTKLILIRHGTTFFNVENKYLSFTNVSLNQTGLAEAKALRKQLKDKRITKVYSSTAKRAFKFADLVFNDSPINTIHDLAEFNFGIFEGLTHTEILARYPKIYKKWLKCPETTQIPRGESFSSFKKRVLKAVENILSANQNMTVALVTHAGPIKVIISELIKLKNIFEIMPLPASISLIEYNGTNGDLRVFNDTAYLNPSSPKGLFLKDRNPRIQDPSFEGRASF